MLACQSFRSSRFCDQAAAVMRLTDKTSRQNVIPAQAGKRAMSFETSGCTTCVALALAATAAVMSAPGQADKMHQMLQWPQLNDRPKAAAIAGAIAENPRVIIPP
jgi:hypothetical protein